MPADHVRALPYTFGRNGLILAGDESAPDANDTLPTLPPDFCPSLIGEIASDNTGYQPDACERNYDPVASLLSLTLLSSEALARPLAGRLARITPTNALAAAQLLASRQQESWLN